MIRSIARKKKIDPSRALNSDIYVPCREGLNFDGYQKAAIAYAQIRQDVLIGDDPGLGKTIEAIGCVNINPSVRKVLVICPAFLKPHWRRSFNDWCTNNLSVEYVKNGKDKSPFICNVVIINYDLLEKFYEELRQVTWDIKIVDEIHKLKNKKAGRTQQIFGGIKRNHLKKIVAKYTAIKAHKSIYMSGTPSLNGKPKELWPLIQQIDPDGLGADWFHYATRYCELVELKKFDPSKGREVHSGWKWDGACNLDEWQKIMRQKFMVRRLKADVLKYLPAKRRMIIPIESDKKLQKVLDEQLKKFEDYAKDKGDDCYLEMPEFGDFSKKMLELGLSMVEPTIEIAESDLEEHDAIVIMCYHKEVAKKIASHFGNQAVLIDGDIAPTKRQALVDRFQVDKTVRVAVGTFGACSESFTMTRAHLMIFPERTWVPGTVTQGEDRIHRRGQLDKVLYKHLVRENSLADRQVRVLIQKQEKLDMMLDKEAL